MTDRCAFVKFRFLCGDAQPGRALCRTPKTRGGPLGAGTAPPISPLPTGGKPHQGQAKKLGSAIFSHFRFGGRKFSRQSVLGQFILPSPIQIAITYINSIGDINMHRAALALTIAVSGAGCSERSVAPAQAPSVPLADVLSAIKQEVAEYNHQATAAPIRLNCNGHQAISMRLIGVKVEVQSSLVSRMGRDAAPEVFLDTIPVLFDPSSAASAFVTNRQTTTLNFDVPPMRRGCRICCEGHDAGRYEPAKGFDGFQRAAGTCHRRWAVHEVQQ